MVASNIRDKGKLCAVDDDTFGGRVFYVVNKMKHWVLDAKWCTDNGFEWPDDVQSVSKEFLLACDTGRPVAALPDAVGGSVESIDMRTAVCAQVSGSGIEFGAASNPLPFPLTCDVAYADIFTQEELIASMYSGQSVHMMMTPDYLSSLDEIDELQGAWDFIAAAHVIEFVRDPVGAIARCAIKLNPGGKLILFVPDMNETFDRDRKATPLGHLIQDFYEPSRERDKEHFQDFYSLSFPISDDQFENTWSEKWEQKSSIHYHVWTAETFKTMVEWIIKDLRLYSEYLFYPTVGNEFCCVLTK
jgi:SAM-dependent methyltransferase